MSKKENKQQELSGKEKVLAYLEKAKDKSNETYRVFRNVVELASSKGKTLANVFEHKDLSSFDQELTSKLNLVYNVDLGISYLDSAIMSSSHQSPTKNIQLPREVQTPRYFGSIQIDINSCIDILKKYIEDNYDKLFDSSRYDGYDDEGYDLVEWFVGDELPTMIHMSNDDNMHITIFRIIRLLTMMEYVKATSIDVCVESCGDMVTYMQLLPYTSYVLGKTQYKDQPVVVDMLKLNCMIVGSTCNCTCSDMSPYSANYGIADIGDYRTSVLTRFTKYGNDGILVDSVFDYISYILSVLYKLHSNSSNSPLMGAFNPFNTVKTNNDKDLSTIVSETISHIYYTGQQQQRDFMRYINNSGYSHVGSTLGYFLEYALCNLYSIGMPPVSINNVASNATMSNTIIPLSYLTITRYTNITSILELLQDVMPFANTNISDGGKTFYEFITTIVSNKLVEDDRHSISTLCTLIGYKKFIDLMGLSSPKEELSCNISKRDTDIMLKCHSLITSNNFMGFGEYGKTYIGTISQTLSQLSCIECIQCVVEVLESLKDHRAYGVGKFTAIVTRLEKVSPYELNDIFSISKSKEAFKHYVRNKLR